MNVNGKHYRAIWLKDQNTVQIIDQTQLPHKFVIKDLTTVNDFIDAINKMWIRGAPLIGVTAAYGLYTAIKNTTATNLDSYIEDTAKILGATRPTAVNLMCALKTQLKEIAKGKTKEEKIALALKAANDLTEFEVDNCKKIGQHGLKIIKKIHRKKLQANKDGDNTVNILTHCNAGWIACIDYGTALAPIYAAYEAGIKIHVWVDETRPRNQGAKLTAWELLNQGIPHHVIADNTGGHLMQHNMVDLVILGCDRATYTGDVANKIGTYLKALAAKANKVPFYSAFPSSTFDWTIKDGVKEIPIETRDENEIKYMDGLCDGVLKEVLITPVGSPALNYGFDVTPAKYITGLITERGICKPNAQSILKLFPEMRGKIFLNKL